MMHYVYRLHDDDGALLYVGVTGNLDRRLRSHAGDKDWWCDVAQVTVEGHVSRAAAEAAEQLAIGTESPAHNIRLYPDPEVANPIREALREAAVRKDDAERAHAAAMLDIGEWVRRGRGMSITELADLAGVSRPTVYAILEDHGTT